VSKRNPDEWPFYGPHGDLDSKDKFEWAQARMPEGWHVEGQVIGGRWQATSLHDDWVTAYAPEALVEAVEKRGAVL
jgi:hypothetical protein